MTPFYFGPPQRRLFGVLHQPTGPSNGRALLVCNPFGQEAIRLHRLQRVLADRFARSGMHVLRFDFFATGDSDGDDADGDLKGWIQDVILANQELLERSGASDVVWLGSRLGGTLAAQASSLTIAPQRLILWEPVVDGQAYLKDIAAAHVSTLELSYCFPQSRWRELLDAGSNELDREGVGFEIGTLLRSQLAALTARSLPAPRTQCVVAYPRDSQSLAGLVSQWRNFGSDVRGVDLDHDFDWLAEEALNTSLVPAQVAARLGQLVLDAHE